NSRKRLHHPKMPLLAFEVGCAVQSVIRLDGRVLFGREHLAYLGRRPDVELSFLVLGVSVERRVKAALRGLHLAHHPLHGLPYHALERRLPGDQPRIAVESEQRRVVVEHLLEVRDAQILVDAVAGEAAADVVINAPFRHLRERQSGDRQAQLAAVQRMTPQAEGKLGRMGKLWSLPDAAVDVVEYLCELTYRGL